MPNYGVHRTLGWVVGVPVSALAFIVTLLTTFSISSAFVIGITAFASTIVGSVIPDIDLSQPKQSFKFASIPYRGLVNSIRAILLFIAFLMVLNFSQVVSAIGLFFVLLGLFAGVFLFSRVPDILHSKMPKHRGLTHQIPPWIVFAIGGTVALRYFFAGLGATDLAVAYLPPAIAPPLALGAMCHIMLDLLVSLWKSVRKIMSG